MIGKFHHIGVARWEFDAETRCFSALGGDM